MAAVFRRDSPTKSFFSSPSHTLRKLVHSTFGVFPKSQQQQELEKGQEEEEEEEFIYHLGSSQDEDEISPDEKIRTDFSDRSDSQHYPRPRIREDLLPYDFFDWQKSPCGSAACSAPSETGSSSKEAESFSGSVPSVASLQRRCPSPTGIKRETSFFMDTTDNGRHLHEAKSWGSRGQAFRANVAPRYGETAGLSGLSNDRKSWRRGAANGSCRKGKQGRSAAAGKPRMQDMAEAGDGVDINMDLYHNLVDMFPLMQTIMEGREDRQHSNVQHHASMVYTRTPLRDTQPKKITDRLDSGRSCKNRGKAKSQDNHNMVRRVQEEEEEDVSWSPRSDSPTPITSLRSRIEELQGQLADRDAIVDGLQQNSEAILLARTIKELQSELAEKDLMWALTREKLLQREEEIYGMHQLLKRAEEKQAGLKDKEEEVQALNCEVAALRCQMEKLSNHTNTRIEAGIQEQQDLNTKKDTIEIEVASKMYMAAIVAAKHSPVEESLALVGELRMQLQSFLLRPTLCC